MTKIESDIKKLAFAGFLLCGSKTHVHQCPGELHLSVGGGVQLEFELVAEYEELIDLIQNFFLAHSLGELPIWSYSFLLDSLFG